MNEILGNAILGAVKRRLRQKKAARPKTSAKTRFARMKLLAALRKKKLAAASKAKKPIVRKILSRMSPAGKKALIKRAILKNPALKKKLAVAVVKKRLADRQAGKFMAPGQPYKTPVPASPAAPNPTRDPSAAPIPEEDTMSPAEAVQEEQAEAPMEEAAEEAADNEEAAEEATEETTEDLAENAEAEAEDLTEPDAEEVEEQAEEAAEDAAEAAETAGDNLILGYALGKRNQRLRMRRGEALAAHRAAPLCRKLESASLGGISAKKTVKGVKVIARAKRGDKKAKVAIKAVAKKAAKGDKKAKKAMAQLKISQKVLKKTTPKKKTLAKKPLAKKTGKTLAKRKVPYTKPVKVENTGLFAHSAHQRGLAMIPGMARTRYGQW